MHVALLSLENILPPQIKQEMKALTDYRCDVVNVYTLCFCQRQCWPFYIDRTVKMAQVLRTAKVSIHVRNDRL